ncbi:MAG: AAA family ATPase, partial [Deltaproteobacteria bacterium]|nr:AAA family ATPase [Deltaproteobacteria bacterium]
DSHCIDLLKTDSYLRYRNEPWLLREELSADKGQSLVVIDEIQITF